MRSGKVDQAIGLVKDLIQSGSVRAGDRLPSEGELAAQLGVSRNSPREAVRARVWRQRLSVDSCARIRSRPI